MAFDYPAFGQAGTSNELRKQRLFISPGWVRGVWLRYGIEALHTHLKALEARVAQDGFIFTKAQIVAMEPKKKSVKHRCFTLL